jgi:saccharopine dehydrogenase-like NADP-dependent oxidoreductase
MFVKNMIPEKGVLAPERIPSQPFLDLMNTHGVPWHVMDLPVSD